MASKYAALMTAVEMAMYLWQSGASQGELLSHKNYGAHWNIGSNYSWFPNAMNNI